MKNAYMILKNNSDDLKDEIEDLSSDRYEYYHEKKIKQ